MDTKNEVEKVEAKNLERSERVEHILPDIDILKVEDGYEIHTDMPGVSEQDLDIEIEKDVLEIKAVRHMEDYVDNGYEMTYGISTSKEYRRSIHLPDGIDRDKIDASFKNGVLKIKLPASPEKGLRKIKVKAE